MHPTNISTEKPPEVTGGTRLLYASLVFGVIEGALNFAQMASEAPIDSEVPMNFIRLVLGFTLLIVIFTFGVTLFLIIKISHRRNWARVTFLVLFLLSLPFAILSVLRFSLVDLFGILTTLLQSIAICLLYSSSATAWFTGHEVNPEVG
jgi:heme/copper-type cytochrome/quinol oxidase subunit 2